MPVGAQNDTDPIERQCNLESVEENKILKMFGCALRQGLVMRLSMKRRRRGHRPAFAHFPSADRSG
jgi:hypothetical protein